MSRILGIDVSDWQDPCDFAAVADAGYSFVYAKATEGSNYIASTFASKKKQAQAAGLLFSAYHFMDWTQTAFSQATHFLNQSPYGYGDLMPILDCEGNVGSLNPKAVLNKIETWLELVEQNIKRKPGVYLSPSFWSDELGGTDKLNEYPLVLANYGVPTPPNLGEWKPMIWQYTSSGTVPGIEGRIDIDEFLGTREQLEGLRGK